MSDQTEQQLQAELSAAISKPKPPVLFWIYVILGSFIAFLLSSLLNGIFLFRASTFFQTINQILFVIIGGSWLVLWVNLIRRTITRIGIRRILKSLDYLHKSGVFKKP